MPSDNAQIVSDIYQAFGRGEFAEAFAMMSPAMVWKEADDFPYADGNPYVGAKAILEGVFARVGGEWDGWDGKIEAIHDAGNAVIALGRYSGTYKETGNSLDAQFVHVWNFEEGRPVHFQQYANTLAVARAIGTA